MIDGAGPPQRGVRLHPGRSHKTIRLSFRDAAEESQRLRAKVRACSDAEPLHLCGSHWSNSVELSYWQRLDEGGAHLGRDDELPVRLTLTGRELAEELVVGDPGGSGKLRLIKDAGTN